VNDEDVLVGELNYARLPTFVEVLIDQELFQGWHRPHGGAS
jgi:hypothetical protein